MEHISLHQKDDYLLEKPTNDFLGKTIEGRVAHYDSCLIIMGHDLHAKKVSAIQNPWVVHTINPNHTPYLTLTLTVVHFNFNGAKSELGSPKDPV